MRTNRGGLVRYDKSLFLRRVWVLVKRGDNNRDQRHFYKITSCFQIPIQAVIQDEDEDEDKEEGSSEEGSGEEGFSEEIINSLARCGIQRSLF